MAPQMIRAELIQMLADMLEAEKRVIASYQGDDEDEIQDCIQELEICNRNLDTWLCIVKADVWLQARN